MRILIIDDEITALTKLKVLLVGYGECVLNTKAELSVRLFQDAIDNQTPYDLVLIDIHLAEANGLDLLETLTRMETESEIPHSIKMMVTASGTKENLMKAYAKGCDGFLVKPIKRDVLDEKMQSFGFAKQTAPTPAPPIENRAPVEDGAPIEAGADTEEQIE